MSRAGARVAMLSLFFWSFASGTIALGYRIIDVRYSLIKHVDFNCWLFNVDLELDGGKKSSQ